MRHTRTILALVAVALCAAVAQADRVERRGASGPVEGQIVRVDDNGVAVRTSVTDETVISWDRVRDVLRLNGERDPGFNRRREMATDLWRARTRLERHDATLAEPLLEKWFDQFIGLTSETALVVSEGLLRCRLERGAHESAVVPALEAIRLRRAGVVTNSYGMLPPVIDESAWVCRQLPPIWLQPGPMQRLVRDLSNYDAPQDPFVQHMSKLYETAVRRQQGETVESLGEAPAGSGGGLLLLSRLVEALSAEEASRRSAREALEGGLSQAPEWARAWSRYAIGMSLTSESGRGRQQRGLVHLAHLPVEHGRSQPYLAGLALLRMATVLEADGAQSAAESLRLEMARRYPNHITRRLGPSNAAVTTLEDDS